MKFGNTPVSCKFSFDMPVFGDSLELNTHLFESWLDVLLTRDISLTLSCFSDPSEEPRQASMQEAGAPCKV